MASGSGPGPGQRQSPNPGAAASAADGDGAGAKELVFEAPPQPMREEYVQNAVKFLSHPKVRGSPVVYRRSFLEKKGLTTQEIDEAFRRVPDSQPSATAAAASQQQANNQSQSAGVQTYAPVQSVQPASGPVVLPTQPRFSWYQAFLAAGLLLGFGASAAVFIKKLFLPRLKSWIRNIVAEGDETEGRQPKAKIDDETAEAVKASALAVSAIAKTNQELLVSKDEEKKILVTLTQSLDSQAKELKSLTESLNHSRESINISREDRFSQYRPLEEHVPPAIRNGPVNSSWRTSQQANMYGVPNSDFGSGRSSFVPAPTEPTSGSFSRSYAETMSTAQRDRSSGSKPWEMQQYSQQRPGYGSNSQLSDDGSHSEAQDNYAPPYHQNGKGPDFQADVPRPLAYNTGVEERPPPQRRWVPPQPPGVVMPEAAAAIRQPKTLQKQPSSEGAEAAGEMQVNGAPSASAVDADVPVNGGTESDAGRSEIEEHPEAI
ncbi:peroxisomal membrane protein PEX14-like isoform X1 [Phragmites australis]|uniref:peroxisomal membrane protein PEX14-like isoform X1 n=1 Tax=Phragmites australis TaxID=29695 RepID=UPI002D773BF9|nr:peroxisomal membrane protein PEX14-like isoform X1 [Phragmites australis]